VARVNNQIITRSDLQKADSSLRGELSHDARTAPRTKSAGEYKDKQKDLLRDLIDQQLLVERAKDMSPQR